MESEISGGRREPDITLLAKVSGPQYYLPASVNIASSV